VEKNVSSLKFLKKLEEEGFFKQFATRQSCAFEKFFFSEKLWRCFMPHIPYVDPETVSDPEIKGYLERARREGTPRPESQAVRAHVPNVIRAFSQAWDLTFRNGVVDHALKELCRVYVSKSIQCEY
jgi:hypothetical protein